MQGILRHRAIAKHAAFHQTCAKVIFLALNLILFDSTEIDVPLAHEDPRARHIKTVLRRAPGEWFDVGLVNKARGKAQIRSEQADGLDLAFTWEPPLRPLPAITLIVGLCRPQTARDILRDATTLGAGEIHFVQTERSDPNYAHSSLWTSGEWRRQILTGAAQAFDPRIPTVHWDQTLPKALANVPADATRIALDNYEATATLSTLLRPPPLTLALGPERGWTARDRHQLRDADFTLAGLGERVLRLETAVVATLALVQNLH